MSVYIRVHEYLESSLTNGPGNRFVLWTQGCPLNCEGCFNRSASSLDGGQDMEIGDIFRLIDSCDVEGITISGGEPFFTGRRVNRTCFNV